MKNIVECQKDFFAYFNALETQGGNGGKHCKSIRQDIEIKKLKIKFVLAGWIENPIKSVVLTFPIDKIVFPTVTLCPRDSRPDRWGTAIKIFDQVNTDCGSKR